MSRKKNKKLLFFVNYFYNIKYERNSKKLRELRDKSGLSLRALAEAIGLSHNTLATYERNDVVPTVNNAVKICEYFKVPVEYLIIWQENIN